MAVLRTFILRDPSIAAGLVAFLKEHAGPMVAAGTPLQVTVAKHRRTRSNEANAFMWAAVLTPIAQQVQVAGRWFSAETWNEQLKRDHLPEICAAGVEKWDVLPDGTRELRMSTTDLNTEEMALYLTQVQARAASEWGVVFNEREEA
jgi:hypothetical protein